MKYTITGYCIITGQKRTGQKRTIIIEATSSKSAKTQVYQQWQGLMK